MPRPVSSTISFLALAVSLALPPWPAARAEESDPAAAKTARAFSARDIAELLKHDGAREGKPVGPRSEAARAESGRVEALRPLDVPVGQLAPAAVVSTAGAGRTPPAPEAVNAARYARINESSRLIDPVVLKAEILLDRAHAPPGVIDGRYGSNFAKAIATFETLRGLPVDGKLTRAVWDELGGDTAAPVLGTYEIKPADVVGPFYPDLSPDYAEQARMPDLGYRSAEEMFGERFHMDRKFLRALNPNVDMGVAGNRIIVAEVATLPVAARVARIDVDKGRGEVLAYDARGELVTGYPATIGSDELPSPSGTWMVRGVAPHPTYTYDPKKNFQQGANTQKLILPPGPNNPVGAAFIALTKPTYGIHGTPDPSKIDKTRSHGCVRLTNWNAVELAGLVQVGATVNFIEKPGAPAEAREPDIASLIAGGSSVR